MEVHAGAEAFSSLSTLSNNKMSVSCGTSKTLQIRSQQRQKQIKIKTKSKQKL
jgi:hypothetical protein